MRHTIRWTSEKIQQRITLLKRFLYRRRQPLPPFRLHLISDAAPDAQPVGPEVDDSAWPLIEPGSYWGDWCSIFTLRSTLQCPTDWLDDAPIALWLPLGESGDFSHPEALIHVDGQPYAACDRHHQEIWLSPEVCDGAAHLLALHGWTGMGGGFSEDKRLPAGSQLFMRPCELVHIDLATRKFVTLAAVAHEVTTIIDPQHPSRFALLNALDDAFKAIDLQTPGSDTFYASIPRAHGILQAGIAQAGPPMDVEVAATGHAHIDVAWLWTLAQTRQKCIRTFHTTLRLMEHFPEYRFTQSQPQLYEYVREDAPELFEAIKARIAEGRWEAIGGMWVEADCNVSGAESLARQFVLGRSYFRKHFGADAESPILWLPDVFGYAWNLPQLIKEAGLDYFFTIKIGWNQYNRLPYDSFWWQGLDGTKVLTHFSATPEPGGNGRSTYTALATPTQNLDTWNAFQQKEAQRELLMVYGYGDGGGGPTREMLESIRAMEHFPAIPHMRQMAAIEFFRRMEAQNGAHLPIWNGELYLEFHRGTYTTQSRNKRANRKSEFLLHDAEFLAAAATLLDSGYAYPAADLTTAWKLVCLNQFHDIIPGSSIHEVYVDSLAQYEQVRQIGERVKQEAIDAIGQQMDADVLVINPGSFPRTTPVFWPDTLNEDQGLLTLDGVPVPTQPVDGGTLLALPAELPPCSITALRTTTATPSAASHELHVGVKPTFLENGYVRVEFNEDGDITRIFVKQQKRDVLPDGELANQWIAFEDRPKKWDAWDIDIFYDDKAYFSDPAAAITVLERGPLRATLEIRRRILHSDYTQRVSLTHASGELRFDTRIDWRERNILLKVAFPVDVLSPTATHEIQWGNVERPTHWNTSWDWARFETCAQKWVDLSEGDYGVSLLNDCKYGHDIRDNVMRLTLLRAPTSPDPEADQGEHHFTYSLLPHAGRWGRETIAAAYALNDPSLALSISAGGSAQATAPFEGQGQALFALDHDNLVIETIKWAEDGQGVILRLYESQRQRGIATLRTAFPIKQAKQVNLLEEAQQVLPVDGRTVQVAFRPYQIITLRIIPA